MIRVLVVDDHDLVRDAVSSALLASGDIDVVGTCGDGREAVQLFGTLRPDVVVMDLSMPTMGGVDATRELLSVDPSARVVILTSARGGREVDDAFAVGALSCVFKDDDLSELIRAVHSATGDDRLGSPTLTPSAPIATVAPARRRGWRPHHRRTRD